MKNDHYLPQVLSVPESHKLIQIETLIFIKKTIKLFQHLKLRKQETERFT